MLNKVNKLSKLQGIFRKHMICRHNDWIKYIIYIKNDLIK